MTPPTTREELRLFIFNNSMLSMRGVDRLLAALDTFAVVCPREPTEEMVTTDRGVWLEKFDTVDVGPQDGTWESVLSSNEERCRTLSKMSLTATIAASPFAPKEPTDGY